MQTREAAGYSKDRSAPFEDKKEQFNYEIIFHRLDMNNGPKNAMLSLELKRGGGQFSQESKRRFQLDDGSKQAVINEAYAFNSTLQMDPSRKKFQDKFVDVQINQWKGDTSVPLGELQINLNNPAFQETNGGQVRCDGLVNCPDGTAKLSYQVKCHKNETNKNSSVSPLRSSYISSNNDQLNTSQTTTRSFAYKHHQELSPVPTKKQKQAEELLQASFNNSSHSTSYHLQQQQAPQPTPQNNGTIPEENIANSSVVSQKSISGATKKPGIITINKDKSHAKKYIFANASKKSPQTGITSTQNATAAKEQSSYLSEASKQSSRVSSNSRERQKHLLNSQSNPNNISTLVPAKKEKTYQSTSQLSSQSKSPEVGSRLGGNMLAPRTKTPTPSPRPVNYSTGKKKELGYRELSAEQSSSRMLYLTAQERRDMQQKQQLGIKEKFILEAKLREQAKQQAVDDSQNSSLAQKLSSLSKKIGEVGRDNNNNNRDNSASNSKVQQGSSRISSQFSYEDSFTAGQQQQQSQEIQQKVESKIERKFTFSPKEQQTDGNQGNQILSEQLQSKLQQPPQDNTLIQRLQQENYELKQINQKIQNQLSYAQTELKDIKANFQLNNEDSVRLNEEIAKEREQLTKDQAKLSKDKEQLLKEQSQIKNEKEILIKDKKQSSITETQKQQTMEAQTKMEADLVAQITQLRIDKEQFALQQEQLRVKSEQLKTQIEENKVNQELVRTQQEKNDIQTQKIIALQRELDDQKNQFEMQVKAQNLPQIESAKLMVQQVKQLQQQNQELQVQIKQSQNTVFEYQTHLSKQETIVQELTAKAKEAEANAVGERNREKEQEQREKEQLKKEINDGKLEIQKLQNKVKEGSEIVQRQEQIIQSLQSQLKTLEDALDAKDQEVESIREETNSQLKACLLAREESRINLQQQIKSLAESHQQNTNELQSEIEQSQKNALSEVERLKEELKNKNLEIQRLQEELSGEKAELDRILSELHDTADQLHSTQDQLTELEKEQAMERKEKEILEEDVNSLKEQLQKSTQMAQNSAQRKIDIIQQEKANLEQELKALQNKHDNLAKQSRNLTDSNQFQDTEEKDEQVQELQGQIKYLQQELATKQSEIDSKDVELAKLHDLYSESYSLALTLQASNQSLEINLLQTKQDLCEAINAAFESGGNELVDQIEQNVSFKEQRY